MNNHWLEREAEGVETLVVRYEDLKVDCAGQLRRVANFVGFKLQEARVTCACRREEVETAAKRETKFLPTFSDAQIEYHLRQISRPPCKNIEMTGFYHTILKCPDTWS